MSHTKGPWEVSSTFLICDEDARIVARIDPLGLPELDVPLAESQANALLIAAAPDLLKALDAAREYLLDRVRGTGGFGETVILPKIDAAIAKAEGK